MNNVYLIGGAPRSGKTSAIKKLLSKKPMLGASSDAIRAVLRKIAKPEELPALFAVSINGFDSEENRYLMENEPEKLIKRQNDESDVVWNYCKSFIDSNLEDGQDIALEGVAIRPKYVGGKDFKSIIICNLDNQTDYILGHARSNPYDWLAIYDDNLIRSFCKFNMKLNEYYYDRAKTLNVPVALVRNSTFDADLTKAVSKLLS